MNFVDLNSKLKLLLLAVGCGHLPTVQRLLEDFPGLVNQWGPELVDQWGPEYLTPCQGLFQLFFVSGTYISDSIWCRF
jgi:hypothetical protein